MKPITRLLILAAAIAVNASALGALHFAMLDARLSAQLAAAEPEQVMVSATRGAAALAKSNCPAPKAL
jgi:hypothetical protein